MWKNKKFTLTQYIFREINSLVTFLPGGGISQDMLIKAKIIFVGSDGSTQFSKLPNFQKILYLKFIF